MTCSASSMLPQDREVVKINLKRGDLERPGAIQTGIPWDPAKLLISALRKIGPSATAKQVLNVDDMLLTRWDASKDTWVAAKIGTCSYSIQRPRV